MQAIALIYAISTEAIGLVVESPLEVMGFV